LAGRLNPSRPSFTLFRQYDENKLSEAQQKRVLEGLLGPDIRSNYFAELASRYSFRPQFATWAILLRLGFQAIGGNWMFSTMQICD
jgi:hypothetical protein